MAEDIKFPGFSIFSPNAWAATWGDWCGPGWSGGQRDADLSSEQMAAMPIARSIGPEGGEPRDSPIDKTCHEHDTAYQEADEQTGVDKDELKYEADKKLLEDLDALDWSQLSKTEQEYARQMKTAFILKKLAYEALSTNPNNHFYRFRDDLYRTEFEKITEGNRGDGSTSILDSIRDLLKRASMLLSPIVLDLDGDGIETTRESLTTFFDYDGNGFAESTGWVGADDGLLVRDINGNGWIDDGRELFGSETLLANGSKAAHGYLALAELDDNHDGMLNAADPAFATLMVWKDSDGDGTSLASELITLDQAGVQSISIIFTSPFLVDKNGNQHKQLGHYTTTSGETRLSADVWFQVNSMASFNVDVVSVPDDIAGMPFIQGMGNVRDLHQAMVRDDSLQWVVNQFSSARTLAERNAMIPSIIYKWTGVEDVDPTSRADTEIFGNVIGDARKLAAMEAITGENWYSIQHSPNPRPEAARTLLRAYDQFAEYIYGLLTAQTHLKPLYDKIEFTWDMDQMNFIGDLSGVAAAITETLAFDRWAGLGQLTEFVRTLKGIGLLAQVKTNEFQLAMDPLGSDVEQIINYSWAGLVATSAHDTLAGNSANNRLHGMGGNDILTGYDGDDLFNGGIGNDRLDGGSGNDTYLFERGAGQDEVMDYDAVGNGDVVQFAEGITSGELFVTRGARDLFLSYGSNDRITLCNWFVNDQYRIENFRFADGTLWGAASMDDRIIWPTATESSDILFSSAAADILNGLDGNDLIYAEAGNDTLDGGTGNDTLEGGTGDDTYLFGFGSGQDIVYDLDSTNGNQDRIILGVGIAPEQVKIGRDFQHLYLTLLGTSDQLTLKNWFIEPTARVEQVLFADTTMWDAASMESMANTVTEGADFLIGLAGDDLLVGLGGADLLYGEGGNDTLCGDGGDDTLAGGPGEDQLDGGVGNDLLQGGAGNDRYLFGRASGQDSVDDQGGQDTIQIAADLNPEDVRVWRDPWNLMLSITGTTDRLTLVNWVTVENNKVEQVLFADGTVWDVNLLSIVANTPTLLADYLTGDDGANSLDGQEGNDELLSGAGDDILIGGLGNDRLNGEAGDDLYLFRRGDGQDLLCDYDLQVGNCDTIQWGSDILPEEIQINLRGRDLVLSIAGTTDSVTILGWGNSVAARIEQLSFANGVVWNEAAIQSHLVITGTGGDDTLYGTAGNDILDAGPGNDTLYGFQPYSGTGNDTYLFRLGSGQDTISDNDSNLGNLDTLKMVGIAPSEATLHRSMTDNNVTTI
ncbi:MAG: hypothetical protein HQM04_18240 [Magnetococcales bacterium]|nr:hypothetical protein [Magnetococcales bacterium]MBF0116968.1 hypothetical protein [Magnetococcales bacterium]